jgi:hypothetical protein
MVAHSLVIVVDRHCTMKSRLSPPQKGQKSSSGGSIWEDGGEGILMEVQGELVKDCLQMCDHIHLSHLQDVRHRHQDPASIGSCI